jgi:hypothetical protein
MNDQFRLRTDEIEWREVEGEIVALDLRKLVYISVNQSGAILWPALVEGASKDVLVARLSQAFDLDGADAAADVEAFLKSLGEQDLLESPQS